VFPDAPVKVFLMADPHERGARREQERSTSGVDVVLDLHARDERDARVNPLVPAHDAVVLDTTHRSPEQTLEQAIAIAQERLG